MAPSLVRTSALLLFLLQTAFIATQPLASRATIVDSPLSLKDQYDYIVIGGGTSGLTVANRLTEDTSGTVLDKIPYSQYRDRGFNHQ